MSSMRLSCWGLRGSLGWAALRCLMLLAALLPAAHAASLLSQGSVPTGNPHERQKCFRTTSERVLEVCGTGEIRWKVDVLMQEPVTQFQLSWTLRSLRLRTGQDSRLYLRDHMPAALLEAASRAELGFQGIGLFAGESGALHALAIDSGAAVRPDGPGSFNVPGSPEWDRLFFERLSPGIYAESAGVGCDPRQRNYLSADHAKAIVRRGLRLQQVLACPPTAMAVSAVESALSRSCERQPDAPWCSPQSTATATSDALDRAADQPAVLAAHARLLGVYRRQSEASCKKAMAPVQACLAQQCPDTGGPDEASCQAIPARPWRPLPPLFSTGSRGPCDAQCRAERDEERERKRQEDRDFEQTVQAWTARWGEQVQQCSQRRQQREARPQCLTAAESRCNPQGLNQPRCVQERMKDAPTTTDAQQQLDQARQQRRATGERPNFLD